MPKLKYDKHFRKKASKIIKNTPALDEKLLGLFKRLQEDPFDPFLKTHRLSGNLRDFFSCSLTNDIRVVFKLYDGSVHLIDIGSHDEVY